MEYYSINECCEILDSQRIPITANKRVRGIYPYYGANGIQDYVNDYIFDGEFVLVAEDGGNFGSKDKPIAYRVSGKCWVNNHAHILKPYDFLDVDFLCFSLMFYNTEGLVNGATRQKLNQAQLRRMRVPKLPLVEQKHIVKEIKHIISAKSILQKQINNLNDLIKSRFIEMFENKDFIPTSFSDYADIIDGDRGKNYPKAEEFFSEGYCLFLNAKNVTKKGFDFEKVQFISKEKDELLRKGKLIRGDIVITTRGTIGNIAYYDETIPYENLRINSGMVIIRPKEVEYNPVFFLNAFKYKVDEIKEHNVTGAAQPQLPIHIMSKIQLLRPPIELQNDFANFVKLIDKSKFIVQKQIDDLQELLDSKMDEYFG